MWKSIKDNEVAVLLATYNGEKYLARQLDSILDQTYNNFVIIIRDDCSSDGTMEIIRNYKSKYKDKIRYYINNSNLGYVKNYEKLLEQCSHKYIALSDQDDIWEKDKLLKQMLKLKELEQNNIQAYMIHHDLTIVDKNEKLLNVSYLNYRKYRLSNDRNLGHIMGPCGVMGNTILMNSRLKQLVLPFPNELDSHDYWIALNCELFGRRFFINSSLISYRIHMQNTSNNLNTIKNNFQFKLGTLPNHTTNRKKYLPKLLEVVVDKNDRKILIAYLDYLYLNGSRIKIFFNLIKFRLLKQGIFLKVKVFFKLLMNRKTMEVL